MCDLVSIDMPERADRGSGADGEKWAEWQMWQMSAGEADGGISAVRRKKQAANGQPISTKWLILKNIRFAMCKNVRTFAAVFPALEDARGEMPEWSIGAVSKTVDQLAGPRVRIPVSPQTMQRAKDNLSLALFFLYEVRGKRRL